ncbi:DUF4912 domain-containing protein [Alicyclobacillus acidoterrestris]|uniref:DUF4912 domain-containing protein n=1 Tax=Alicyclobacillus acidoterrestris (strain ATCC 49025 / DSM 3922 / CIP 106132 / NCIMB 13137 / GD3B) TaxID=1356854 RepID=T0CXV4_ALIAG|nr:DUF4912 domain-containing protein [Alicyclobacillus acidoterrestris]EPZ44202.1 hypothetical protein N007_11810 [Alicyclobacillus acidoterrestris ATCC 49025]UNO49714.1 DUF4912 domain-containing protein [Alicyclobacillus acidoterrestris]
MGKDNLYDDTWTRKAGRSRMVAMVKDPFTAFVYWEVDEHYQWLFGAHFHCNWRSLPLFLCVYDVTDCWFDGYNAPLVSQHPVTHDDDNWYLHSLSPGRNYILHLSTTTLENRLFCILSSGVIHLPPAKAGDVLPSVQFSPVASNPSFHRDLRSPSPTEALYPYEATFDGYHVHVSEERSE